MRSGRPEVHHLIVGARVGQSFNKVEWVDDMASRDGEDGNLKGDGVCAKTF